MVSSEAAGAGDRIEAGGGFGDTRIVGVGDLAPGGRLPVAATDGLGDAPKAKFRSSLGRTPELPAIASDVTTTLLRAQAATGWPASLFCVSTAVA